MYYKLRYTLSTNIIIHNRKNQINSRRLLCNRTLKQKVHGLFGIPTLKSPSDFINLTKISIQKIEMIRNYIYSQSNIDSKECLNLLDEISSEICSIIDVAELCRNIHISTEYKQSAELSFEELSKYIHNLNTDNRLYQKLLNITDDTNDWNSLTEEEKIFAIDLKREFESDGIHLEQNKKPLALQLQSQVVQYESIFSHNINNNSNNNHEIHIGPFDQNDDENLNDIKNWLIQLNINQRKILNHEKYFTITTDRRLTYTLLSQIDNPKMRELLWKETYHSPTSNIEALGGLIKSRQLLAKLLGYPSYAHKFLSNKVLNSPEKVQNLLLDLQNSSKQLAIDQLQKLSKMKNTISENNNNNDNNNNNLHPWDINYYSNKYEVESNNIFNDFDTSSTSRKRILTKVKEYLSLDNCIEGLKLISNKLFAITLQPVELTIEEDWTFISTSTTNTTNNLELLKSNLSSSNTYIPSELIKKFYVIDDQTGKLLGTVYMDLYERNNKFPGAAHFTIQCGCERLQFINNNSIKDNLLLSNQTKHIFHNAEQLPIVALVFNFKLSTRKTTLLSLYEVETLHHEWGHALHSLFSRTKFQHLSGTRGGTDFIEIPSHWFEFYSRSPEVISKWAKHYITGEKIPLELLKNALSGNKQFAAIDLQNQILYSAADQYLFGTGIGDVSTLSHKDVYHKAVDGLVSIQQQYTVLPIAKNDHNNNDNNNINNCNNNNYNNNYNNNNDRTSLPTMSLLTHSHFVNYGGGYYSYLFAKMYASQIWYHNFASDPLNRSAGEFLHNKLLKFGSSKPVNEMLVEVAGGNLNPNYYLKTLSNTDL